MKHVLLLSKERSYLVEVGVEKFSTADGIFDLKELKKKKIGDVIKTHLGKEFVIVKPSLKDLLEKKLKRGAQVVLPKDFSLILAYTGIDPKSLVVDCGAGSGFLSISLAFFIREGKVVTYEKNKNFARITKENIKAVGLQNITVKEKDVTKGIDERNVDLVTIDLQNPENVIPHAYKALKPGGFLVVYSPTIEEMVKAIEKIKEKNFGEIKIVENIVREWQAEKTTRPKNIGLMHTGWLIFARKVG